MESDSRGIQNFRREKNLDIAKGIGIILVVWAHAGGPFTSYIESFHMPLFFFVSGMLYFNMNITCKDYIKKKCKSLLLPFWWWNFIFFPIFYILYYWKNWSAVVCIKNIIEIVLTLNKVPFLGATWFLPALFWISVIVHFVLRVSQRFRYADVLLLVCGIVICILGFEITFPYRISRILICQLFYISGYLYRKYLRKCFKEYIYNIGAGFCAILYVLIVDNNSVSMSNNVYEYKIAFIIGAFAAIVVTIRLSEWIMKISALSIFSEHLLYLGQNSLAIVIWQFLAFRLAIIIQIIAMNEEVKILTSFPVYDASGLWWIVYIFTGIYGSLLWNYILVHNPLSNRMKKVHMIR